MKRIVITPLDWGLGHATRCIPIIRELLARACTVFIATSGESLALLKNEFPSLTFFSLPGYNPVYQASGSFVLKMVFQVPKFIKVIKEEHQILEDLIEEQKIDFVISDNRYGCWSSKVPSVIITHQLNILMPAYLQWLAPFVRSVNEKRINKFSICWIPDYPGEYSLAGKLTDHNIKSLKKIMHIGPLSRFSHATRIENKYDVLFIISGPEPQRTVFETIVRAQLKQSDLKYFIARGIPSRSTLVKDNEAEFLDSEALQKIILQSSLVVARSGYSTILDLYALGKKAILIPTPRQTEQEYLAARWKEKNIAYTMPQKTFDLMIALDESKTYIGFSGNAGHHGNLLTDALNQLLLDV